MTKKTNTKKKTTAVTTPGVAEIMVAASVATAPDEAIAALAAPAGSDPDTGPWEAWQRVEADVRAVPDKALVARRIDVRDVFAPTHELLSIARDPKLLAELSELPARHFSPAWLDRLGDLAGAAWYLDGAVRMQVEASKRVLPPELVAEAHQRLEDGRKLLELFVVKEVPGLEAQLALIQAGTSNHGLATAVIQIGAQLITHRAHFAGLSAKHFPPKTPEDTMAVGNRLLTALVGQQEDAKAEWGGLRDRCYTLLRNLFFDVSAAIEFVTRKWDEQPELPALRPPVKAGKAKAEGAEDDAKEAGDEDTTAKGEDVKPKGEDASAKGEDTTTADTKPKGEDVKPKGETPPLEPKAPQPEADAPDDGAPTAANTTDDLPAVGTDG
jgi:hypothetical protein